MSPCAAPWGWGQEASWILRLRRIHPRIPWHCCLRPLKSFGKGLGKEGAKRHHRFPDSGASRGAKTYQRANNVSVKITILGKIFAKNFTVLLRTWVMSWFCAFWWFFFVVAHFRTFVIFLHFLHYLGLFGLSTALSQIRYVVIYTLFRVKYFSPRSPAKSSMTAPWGPPSLPSPSSSSSLSPSTTGSPAPAHLLISWNSVYLQNKPNQPQTLPASPFAPC